MKQLIVNADDFGYSKGINKGVLHAYKQGIVTSTSLMVNSVYAQDAVKIVKKEPLLGIGLHFVWRDDDNMIRRNIIHQLSRFTLKKVEEELIKQIRLFSGLVGKPPDHLNSHHHFHTLPHIFPIFRKHALQYQIPIRSDKIKVIKIVNKMAIRVPTILI